ncbi:MAG TPA: Smr/MutS family protein [Hyphomonadaceae bacterium]|nr:Smr/MutS family protein [Hyphomonadaceae bacterium]
MSPTDAAPEAKLAPPPTAPSPRSARRPGPPDDLSGQRRIRRGQSEIDARLDLHGHTQDTAHRELVSFILREHAAGSRCILVITGKGRLGAGVLRSRFFDWIADPDLRSMIAGYARAHPRHGGEGATYLFLKAKRANTY